MNIEKNISRGTADSRRISQDNINRIYELVELQLEEYFSSGNLKYSKNEIAREVGVSPVTVDNYIIGKLDSYLKTRYEEQIAFEIYNLIFLKPKRHTYSSLKAIVDRAGLILITEEKGFYEMIKTTIPSKVKLKVWCGNEHHKPFDALIANIIRAMKTQHSGCKICNYERRSYGFDKVVEISLENGFYLQETPHTFAIKIKEGREEGKFPSQVELDWICEKGHIVKKSYTRISQRNCKECRDEGYSISFRQAQKLAQEKGYFLEMDVSEFKTAIDNGRANGKRPSKTPLRWKCKNEHIWSTSYITIKHTPRQGTCPKCNKKIWEITPEPATNEHHFDKLKDLPKISIYLKYIINLGNFPDYVLKNIEAYQRCSNFAGQITHINKETKANFIVELFRIDIKAVKLHDKSVNSSILSLIEFSHNKYYSSDQIKPYHGSVDHEFILAKILADNEHAVATEIPVWIGGGGVCLTGHIDLILVIDDAIYICDYKPDESPQIKPRVHKNFINSIPQIAAYGLIIKKNFNIKKLYCITFNKEGAWIYEPEIILKKITTFTQTHKQGTNLPWEPYFIL